VPGAREELEHLRKQKRLQELEARVVGAKKPSENPAQETSSFRRFGQGMADRLTTNVNKIANLEDTVGRKILGAAGVELPETPAKYPWSKESIAQQEAAAAPVADTTAGTVGSIAADAIMTAPLGAIGRGMQAGERLPVVGRLLGNRTAQAAVEGGAAGAMTADPGSRGEDMTRGALTGGALERGGRLLGRTMEGLVRRSPEAQALDNLADLHGTQVRLPLATAASEEGIISPFAKFLYGRVLPALPGTSGTLGRQSQRAAAQLREIAMREAAPGGMGSVGPGYAGGLPMTTAKQSGAGSNVRVSMKDIQDAFAREYDDTIGSYAFNKPDPQEFMTRLKQLPGMDDSTAARVAQDLDSLATKYTKNGTLEGSNVGRMKSELARLGEQSQDELVGEAYNQSQEFIDDFVRRELSQGNKFQNMVDLQRYMDLAAPWKNFQRVQRAAARSADPEGQFTPEELMRSVKSMANDKQLARGSAPMQELASIGQKTVGASPGQPSFLERGMAWGALSGMGLVGSPMGAAATWAGGRTLASPAVQDILMGTNATQQALAKALRKRPMTKRMMGAEVRNLGAIEAADDE